VTTPRAQLRDDWILSQESARTVTTYQHAIDRWFAWCDRRSLDVWEVRRADVDAFRHHLVRGGASRSTLAKNLSILSSFYRYVVQEGNPPPIEHNPVANVRRPKLQQVSEKDGLSAEEARALRVASIASGPRTAALVHVLLGTAVRVSEACNAKVTDVGMFEGERVLTVVRKGGKRGRVLVSDSVWAVVEHYLDTRAEVPEGWLFATTGARQMSRRTAYRTVSELAEKTLTRKRIGPHLMRHTAATLALDTGLPIQEVQGMLGHASSATTQLYDRNARTRGRAASRSLDALYEAEPAPTS
jgi:integrase/recombinase XerD